VAELKTDKEELKADKAELRVQNSELKRELAFSPSVANV
jgi:hypothetical protein